MSDHKRQRNGHTRQTDQTDEQGALMHAVILVIFSISTIVTGYSGLIDLIEKKGVGVPTGPGIHGKLSAGRKFILSMEEGGSPRRKTNEKGSLPGHPRRNPLPETPCTTSQC